MLEYWLWLANRPNIREGNALKLVELFGDVRSLFLASRSDCIERGIRNNKVLDSLADKSMEGVMQILKTCHMRGIHVLSYGDKGYPERLRNISDPPLILYYLGIFPDFDNEAVIGIVGTRKATVYGCHQARQIGFHAARCGGLIVSGMAPGIDITAMMGAFEATNRAVGVLGCGVDIGYPSATQYARKQLERTGCLISEYPPGTRPTKFSFPKRNRIISGLSCGVVVVEAGERSGALITARHALEQGRDVFAVPGNVNSPQSAGANQLLASGAIAVRCGWDVMKEYEHLFPGKVHHWQGGIDWVKEYAAYSGLPKDSPILAQALHLSVDSPIMSPEISKRSDHTVDKLMQTTYIEDKRQKVSQALPQEPVMPEGLSPDEQAVWKTLSSERKHVDEIINQSGVGTSGVLAALTLLEVKGLVVRHPGKFYTLPKA